MAVIVAAIGGALWKHITSDADHREKIAGRLATLEQQHEQDHEEIKSFRTRYHDLRDQLTRYIGDKLNEAVEAVRRFRSRDRDPD